MRRLLASCVLLTAAAAVSAVVTAAAAAEPRVRGGRFIGIDQSWVEDPSLYNTWRKRESVPLSAWMARLYHPTRDSRMESDEWNTLNRTGKGVLHEECLAQQAHAHSKRVYAGYQSPKLREVQAEVKALKKRLKKKIAIAIFYGRERYVRILLPYIERNLAQNMGVVDEVILVTHNRDSKNGSIGARRLLDDMVSRYPGVVREEPFCPKPYGCAFHSILNDTSRVYVKIDDDIVFIKDGSIEHLALQQMANSDFAFYSANIVNNPHGYGVQMFSGAFPPSTYHWALKQTPWTTEPPFVRGTAYKAYYGKNVYNSVGSRSHEAFIWNVAAGRLDVYTFDLWDMHHCKCGLPQEGLGMCNTDNGFYRWSINGFVYEYRNVLDYLPKKTEAFDEPSVGMGWVDHSPQRRVGMVGESLLVHMCYTRQRSAKPRFGLEESYMLPWYYELMKQYTAGEYGGWRGNTTLHTWYENTSVQHKEARWRQYFP